MLLTLLIMVFFAWLMFKLVHLTLSATFGIMSVIGTLLIVLAAPLLLVTFAVTGISMLLFVPLLFLGAATSLLSIAAE